MQTFPFANLNPLEGFRIILGSCLGAAGGSAHLRTRPPDPGSGGRLPLCKEQQVAVREVGLCFPAPERGRLGEMLGLGLVRPEPLLAENHCACTAPTRTFTCVGTPPGKGLRDSDAPRPGPSGVGRDPRAPGAALGQGRRSLRLGAVGLRNWEGSACWQRSGAPPGGLLWWETGMSSGTRPGAQGAPRVLPSSVRTYLSIRSTSARCSAASSVLSACSSLRMGGVS